MVGRVHFIETPLFTKHIASLLDDGDFRRFQVALALNPEAGELIRGSGGLRKIRWSAQGRGKRGGLRVIITCWKTTKFICCSRIQKTNKWI
jgi:mRNA-degrading endonuclease RelE of RelBE toxin-antitoxin system